MGAIERWEYPWPSEHPLWNQLLQSFTRSRSEQMFYTSISRDHILRSLLEYMNHIGISQELAHFHRKNTEDRKKTEFQRGPNCPYKIKSYAILNNSIKQLILLRVEPFEGIFMWYDDYKPLLTFVHGLNFGLFGHHLTFFGFHVLSFN